MHDNLHYVKFTNEKRGLEDGLVVGKTRRRPRIALAMLLPTGYSVVKRQKGGGPDRYIAL